MKILEIWELFNSLDLAHFQLLRLRVENLAAAPSAPERGWVYYDTVLDQFRGWDGTEWLNLGRAQMTFGSVESQLAFGSAAQNGVSGNAARADHRHGTPPHGDAAHTAVHLSALDAPIASVDCGGQRFINAADPVDDSDLATKQFVTYNSYGLDVHQSVDLVMTTETLFTDPPEGEMVIDGILTNSSRVLVAQTSDPSSVYNGIWVTDALGWARATDANADGEIQKGSAVYVSQGKSHQGELWACYDFQDAGIDDWEPDTDPSYWTVFSSLYTTQAGVGLSRSGNTLNVVAGTGIDLSGGVVAIDGSVIPQKIAATIGDGIETDFEIPLGYTGIVAADAIVQVFEIATGETVAVKVVRGASSIFVSFDAPPDASSMRVVIMV